MPVLLRGARATPLASQRRSFDDETLFQALAQHCVTDAVKALKQIARALAPGAVQRVMHQLRHGHALVTRARNENPALDPVAVLLQSVVKGQGVEMAQMNARQVHLSQPGPPSAVDMKGQADVLLFHDLRANGGFPEPMGPEWLSLGWVVNKRSWGATGLRAGRSADQGRGMVTARLPRPGPKLSETIGWQTRPCNSRRVRKSCAPAASGSAEITSASSLSIGRSAA